MKIRIRDNSLRVRVGRSEVRKLHEGESLEQTTQFDPAGTQRLVCTLRSVADEADGGAEVRAGFQGGAIWIEVPTAIVAAWATTEQVGIERLQPLGEAGSLRILIEKDFECIDETTEPQDDAYPHPLNASKCPPRVERDDA